MAVLHAKQHTFLIGQEVTFGTAVTADKDVGLVQSFTPSDKRTIDEVYASGSRQVQELVPAKSGVTWDLDINLQNGRLFEYIFGAVSHALTGSDTKHTFTIATTLPSMTIESSFNATVDKVFIYSGGKINSAVVNLDTNAILKLSSSGMSQGSSSATATASAAVISSLAVLHYKNSTLSTGTADAETSVGKLQTSNINIENNIEEIDAAGTFVTQEMIAASLKIAFDFTMMFEDQTEYDIFQGGTTPQQDPAKKGVEFNANNGVTLGSGRREFNAQFTNFLYEEVGTPVTVGESVVQSFKGIATGIGTNGVFYVDNIAEASFS
ncbi:MAG: phage tail tube protein [Patescibacteria group bacterium]|nr:phage tail tube protein [Patescibacteria group bacterium]